MRSKVTRGVHQWHPQHRVHPVDSFAFASSCSRTERYVLKRTVECLQHKKRKRDIKRDDGAAFPNIQF